MSGVLQEALLRRTRLDSSPGQRGEPLALGKTHRCPVPGPPPWVPLPCSVLKAGAVVALRCGMQMVLSH